MALSHSCMGRRGESQTKNENVKSVWERMLTQLCTCILRRHRRKKVQIMIFESKKQTALVVRIYNQLCVEKIPLVYKYIFS